MDQHTNLRVLARAVDFRGVCDLIFGQLLHFGANDPTIVLGLLRIIEVTLHRTENPAYLVVLYHQVLKIEIASGKIHDYYERRQVEGRVDATSRLAVDKINSAKVAQSDYFIKLLNIIIECSDITNNTYYIAGFNRQVERIDSAAHRASRPRADRRGQVAWRSLAVRWISESSPSPGPVHAPGGVNLSGRPSPVRQAVGTPEEAD